MCYLLRRRDKFNILRAMQAIIVGFTYDLKWNLIVMGRHGGRNLPLGGAGIPNITGCFLAMLQAAKEVDEEDQNREADQETCNGHHKMRRIQTKCGIIIHTRAPAPTPAGR